MKNITYGAPRLVDWMARIQVGSATMRIHFTGGALTQYGVTPAQYTTSDGFVQAAIEQSEYYKEGRIIKVRELEIAGATNEPQRKAQKTEQQKEAMDIVESTVNTDAMEAERTVEVSCLQDAQAYLQEQYGIANFRVRTYDAAQKAAVAHGIKFVGAKFDELSDSPEQD